MALSTLLGIGSLASSIGSALFGKKSSSSGTSEQSTTGEQVKQFGEQQFSDELLAQLEGLFTSSLGSDAFGQGQGALTSRLGQLQQQAAQPEFDVAGFAQGITDQARSGAMFDLEGQLNSLMSSTGGSTSGNSMNALLANRLRNDTAANLAGIESAALAQGEQIRLAREGQLTSGIQGLSDSVAGQILNLINTTAGARTAGTATTDETQHVLKKQSTSTKDKGNPFSAFADFFSVLGNSSLNA